MCLLGESSKMLLLTVILSMAIAPINCRTCSTYTGMKGTCVNIKKCAPVIRLLKSRPPMKIYNELRSAHCGFEDKDPKICCEQPPQADEPVEFTKPKTLKSALNLVVNHPNYELLNRDLCGPTSNEPRIFGGSAAKLFEFPWMALLAFRDGSAEGKSVFRCSATIINEKYVLTAAHCVTNLPEHLKVTGVRVGEHDLSKEIDCENYESGTANVCAEKHQDFGIEKVHPHPHYSATTLQNDIALIRINGSVNFKPASARPICLPLLTSTRLDMKTGQLLGQVTGWGSTENGTLSSDVLRKVSLPIFSRQACARSYQDQPLTRLSHKQICAGGVKGKDSCVGDSGGPLQALRLLKGKPRVVQYGIVSFGRRNCAEEGTPGVYTDVAQYVDWILDNIHE